MVLSHITSNIGRFCEKLCLKRLKFFDCNYNFFTNLSIKKMKLPQDIEEERSINVLESQDKVFFVFMIFIQSLEKKLNYDSFLRFINILFR